MSPTGHLTPEAPPVGLGAIHRVRLYWCRPAAVRPPLGPLWPLQCVVQRAVLRWL